MPRNTVAVLALVALLISACGNGEPADTVATTTTVPTTSTTSDASSTVDMTTSSNTEAQALQSCPGATGNSPATFDGSDGTYAAFIVEFIAPDIPLSFDVVQWMTGEAAREAYREDHPEDSEGGPPNDYYVRNQSTKTREADVASDGKVWLVKMDEDNDADVDRASFEELSSYNEYSEERPAHIFWLRFENDEIVEICEQFRP